MAKINMKKIAKAVGLLGLGATIGHITQVIHDCGIADGEEFNALGRFSMAICKHWKTIGDGVAETKEETKNEEPEETTVDEADDEWSFDDDLPEEEEPSE